ncbi:MAG: fluoride efflux transporter FluC [Acidimicrobiales bacterium]|jgi:CrcB protein
MVRLLLIALAGAAGALCRLGANNLLGERPLPVATLVVNVAGSFALGVLLAWGTTHLSPEALSALAVGFLGAFTTFSTFTLEAVELHSAGRAAVAAGYVGLSVVLGLAAAVTGRALGQWLLAQ